MFWKSFDEVQDITVLQTLFIMVAGGFGMVIPLGALVHYGPSCRASWPWALGRRSASPWQRHLVYPDGDDGHHERHRVHLPAGVPLEKRPRMTPQEQAP